MLALDIFRDGLYGSFYRPNCIFLEVFVLSCFLIKAGAVGFGPTNPVLAGLTDYKSAPIDRYGTPPFFMWIDSRFELW